MGWVDTGWRVTVSPCECHWTDGRRNKAHLSRSLCMMVLRSQGSVRSLFPWEDSTLKASIPVLTAFPWDVVLRGQSQQADQFSATAPPQGQGWVGTSEEVWRSKGSASCLVAFSHVAPVEGRGDGLWSASFRDKHRTLGSKCWHESGVFFFFFYFVNAKWFLLQK